MLFMGNLDSRVDRRLLYEIGVQAGRVAAVNVPIDPIFNKNKGYGFIVGYETKNSRAALPLLRVARAPSLEGCPTSLLCVSLWTCRITKR